ncbi:MAG: hypothetical protein KFH87_04400, partial [Bacteroidetes bacterium]|nr:hypothetical protein [Bacteroidota bacterium]
QTGLFRSTDRGASWESIDDALPNDVVYSVSVPDGNMLHVGLNNATFRSSDQGETWEELPDLALHNTYAVQHAGAATLLAETSGGPFISHDGGSTWQQDVFEPFGNVSGLWVRSDGLLLFSANGRVQRSDDGGRTYEVSDMGLFVQNITHIEIARVRYDSLIFMVGTANDGVYVSWNGSDRWEHATPGYWNYGVREIHFTEHSAFPDHESTVAVLTEDGEILRSSDLWEHWELLADSLEAGPFLSITAAEPFYTLATDGEVLYHEKRTGWKRRGSIQPGSGGIGDATLQKSGIHLLAATDRGPYFSPNNGVTWELLLVDGLPRYFVEAKASPHRDTHNCFGVTTTQLFLSTDFFRTWSPIPQAFTAPRYLVYNFMRELVFADVNDIKIISPQFPNKITPFSTFPYEGFTTLGLLYGAVPLAGTASRGVYKSAYSTISVPETPPAPALFELSDMYPVPLHSVAGSGADVHLRLQLRTPGTVIVEVCDLTGKVLHRHERELHAGDNTLHLSVPDVATSMLLLRVHGPGGAVQRLLPVLSSR